MDITGRKRGDMVLESRHLVGVFLLMVVIFGVVFTLGYLLGHSQTEPVNRMAANKVAAAPATPAPSATATGDKNKPANPAGPPAPSDWDFYKSGDAKKNAEKAAKVEKPAPPGKTVTIASKPQALAAPSKPVAAKDNTAKSLLNAPLVPKGAIVLQVAALTKEADALALAEALQQKHFPAFVLTPSTDNYYRVQVGPYADQQSASITLKKLQHEGFKAIVKR